MVPWEQEVSTDDGMPEPTKEMQADADFQSKNLNATVNITNLSPYEDALIRISKEKGMPMLKIL